MSEVPGDESKGGDESVVSDQKSSIEQIREHPEATSSNETSEQSTSSSNSSSSSSDSKSDDKTSSDPLTKRRRKRKRHPKKKKITVSTAYIPEEPFKARYEKLPFFINSAAPKVHLRFDEEGNADETKSDFNYKPRIIRAYAEL